MSGGGTGAGYSSGTTYISPGHKVEGKAIIGAGIINVQESNQDIYGAQNYTTLFQTEEGVTISSMPLLPEGRSVDKIQEKIWVRGDGSFETLFPVLTLNQGESDLTTLTGRFSQGSISTRTTFQAPPVHKNTYITLVYSTYLVSSFACWDQDDDEIVAPSDVMLSDHTYKVIRITAGYADVVYDESGPAVSVYDAAAPISTEVQETFESSGSTVLELRTTPWIDFQRYWSGGDSYTPIEVFLTPSGGGDPISLPDRTFYSNRLLQPTLSGIDLEFFLRGNLVFLNTADFAGAQVIYHTKCEKAKVQIDMHPKGDMTPWVSEYTIKFRAQID